MDDDMATKMCVDSSKATKCLQGGNENLCFWQCSRQIMLPGGHIGMIKVFPLAMVRQIPVPDTSG